MTVATLYDIHGNLAALEAVLAQVPDEATIVVGGDVVAAGAHPSQTLERLRGLGERVRWVRGNADRELMPGEPGLAPPGAFDATRAQLTEEQIAFLHALPPTLLLDGVLYCHASPRNDLDIFGPRTPEERIAFLFEDVDADVVVCGHTHVQFERVVGGVRVVNSGSVGAAYEREPGAYWMLDLQHRRTEYPGMAPPEASHEEWLDWVEAHAV